MGPPIWGLGVDGAPEKVFVYSGAVDLHLAKNYSYVNTFPE